MQNPGLALLAIFALWCFFTFLLLIHEYGHLLACAQKKYPLPVFKSGRCGFFG